MPRKGSRGTCCGRPRQSAKAATRLPGCRGLVRHERHLRLADDLDLILSTKDLVGLEIADGPCARRREAASYLPAPQLRSGAHGLFGFRARLPASGDFQERILQTHGPQGQRTEWQTAELMGQVRKRRLAPQQQ